VNSRTVLAQVPREPPLTQGVRVLEPHARKWEHRCNVSLHPLLSLAAMRLQPARLAARFAARVTGLPLGVQAAADPMEDGARGFHESSFDLRQGLDIHETEAGALPDDLRHELARQASSLR